MTKDFLKEYILSMLGANIQDVELDEKDLDFIIYKSINQYMEKGDTALNEEWTVIPVEQDNHYAEIPEHIDFVISVNSKSGSSGQGLIPETFGQAYENMMLSMITNDNNLQTNNTISSRIIYKDGSRYIRLDPAPTESGNLAAKVLTYKDLSAIYSDNWVQKYAIAQAKLLLGNIRSKYSGISAPNDMSMNGSDLISQAQSEIEKLELELFEESVLYSGGIYLG